MSNEGPRTRRAIGPDLIIPVAASLYAVYYVASVWDFPAEAQRSGLFLAVMLLSLTTLFFIRTGLAVARGKTRWDFQKFLGPRESRRNRFAFIGLTILYIFVVPYGGFTLTTFLFLLIGSLLAGLRPLRKAVIFAGGAALSGWLFFIVLLGTRFPSGPFEHLVSMVASPWS